MNDDLPSTDTSVRLPREYVGSLVAIRPGRKLVFNVDSPIKRMSRNITIRNISNFPVTFKIKTTSREGYRVKPHTGLLESGQSADTVITLLPHNQYRVPQDKFLVMVARADSKFKAKDKRKLENFWKKFSKEKFGADYMEHQLGCALNVDEYLANEEEDEVATDSEIDRRFYDETVMADDYTTPDSSLPAMKELMNRSIRLPDMFKKDRNFNSDKDSQNISTDEVVISLMRTEDVLKKHILCFKGFQVFVVVAICALCIIIIILMVNFPSAITVQKSGS